MSEYLIDSNGLKIEFHYEDSEASETLLFLPGSYANTSAWKGITKALKVPCKKVFTSLRGYGNTEETRSVSDYKIDHQLEIIRTISKKLNSDFHIVGHSMGGLVGFAAVFSGEFPIKSIITFEANPLWVLDTSRFQETLNKINISIFFVLDYNTLESKSSKFMTLELFNVKYPYYLERTSIIIIYNINNKQKFFVYTKPFEYSSYLVINSVKGKTTQKIKVKYFLV